MSDSEIRMLVSEYKEWRRRSRESTDSTLTSIRHVLDKWEHWPCDHLAPEDDEMVAFAWRTRKNGEPSKYRVKNDLLILRGFYDWAYRYEKLPKDYGVRLRDAVPKISERLQRHIPLGKFYALPHDRFRDETVFILGLGWFNGLRINEMSRLKVEDIQDGRLLVKRKKTARGVNHQPLPWRTLGDFLVQHHEEAGHDARKLWDRFEDLMTTRAYQGKTYLIPEGNGDPEKTRRLTGFIWNPIRFAGNNRNEESLPFTPHDLRHSFGHNMFQAGVPIEKVARTMGHATSKTTETYYVDASLGLEDDLIERMMSA